MFGKISIMTNFKRLKYVILSGILLFASLSFAKTTFEIMKSNARLEELQAEVNLLAEEKELLEESLSYQKTAEYVEEEARNKLNMVKDGEEIYVIGDKLEEELAVAKARQLEQAAVAGDTDHRSNFGQWLELVF